VSRNDRAALPVAAALLLASPAFGQTAPNPAQALPPTVSPIPRETPQPPPQILPPLVPPPAAAPPAAEVEQIIELSSLKIEGATRYSEAQLLARFAPLLHRKRPLAEITQAVRELENDYHKEGFFLTRVRGVISAAPEGNVLDVRVLEGYVGSVKLDGDIGPAGTLVYDYLQHLTEFRPLNAAELERYVLLAKNVPGVEVVPVLRPLKDEPGAVELVAKVSLRRIDAMVQDDDRGPATLGPNELLVTASLNSLTSLGDRTTVSIFNTPFDNEEVFGQLSEDVLVGSEGLKLGAYIGYGVLEPGSILRPAQYKSLLFLTGVQAEYPVVRTRALTVRLVGNFDVSNTIVDEQDFTPSVPHLVSKDDLRIFRAGTRTDFQDTLLGPLLPGANLAELKLHLGVDDLFGGTKGSAPFLARPKEDPNFRKLTAKLVRTQQLYAWPVSRLELITGAAGQWTDDVLPPSEKFFLGGTEFGRGFYNGEVTGDRAVTGKIQLQLADQVTTEALGDPKQIGLDYYLYYDIGQIWDLRPTGDPSEHVESLGLGIQADLTEHVSLQVEGTERFTRRPTGTNTNREREHALFFGIIGRY
jgi:hemolysin activation/secretion protein